MTKPHPILEALARAPNVDPAFKRGVAMLLQPVYDPAQHLKDALPLMGEDDYATLQRDMKEIADAAAAWQKAKDAIAALSNKWGTSALGLAEADGYLQEMIAEFQGVVRRSYAEVYIP